MSCLLAPGFRGNYLQTIWGGCRGPGGGANGKKKHDVCCTRLVVQRGLGVGGRNR